MTPRLSLANRLGLLFAACTAAVSLLAGVLFNRASEAHFIELDQQLLNSRVAVFRSLLKNVDSPNALNAHRPALDVELRHHPDLSLQILGHDGSTWFASSAAQVELPALHTGLHDLKANATDYRVLDTPLHEGQRDSPRLRLLLDITHHQHFLQRMQQLIWLTVGLSALATALLGAWVARRGLRPLRQMTELASSMSASSLTHRLDEHDAPVELTELIRAFNAMLARLDYAFVRLSAFSADIAHELRTPLSNLLTQTQVTLSQPRDLPSYREALHSNLEELQHLAQMVGDMLFLAKAEHGLLPTRREPLDMGPELQAVADYFTPLAEETGVGLRVSGSAPLQADRSLLRRALSNLLDNALRFTPAGGEIHLTAETGPDGIRLIVANQGESIPAESLPRLFDRFFRADPARREGQAEHAGLGLAITRSIVHAHGGKIRCLSADGWTRFILEFPSSANY
ncbi:heavy metal sensor histidine kinase [Pseudomonas sp. LS44]|uniref:heavy metal sensor histidine kinase n=1 Tax=Pseudomonas sp. LS44 TaxID=1357074 RepID=UPI00215AC7C1|nr:heavy metal sensor histidine kinase [Pseudomonas sp. LS44]UVE16187.1 heavy metal sensor histidine kinase [Pseudomonas sp. LS44]